MLKSFFRPEVAFAHQASWLGSIRVDKNFKFSIATALALVLVSGAIAFLILGKVTRKARISGIVLPEHGMVQLSSNASGILVEQLVKEGEYVHEGQPLFVIETDRSTIDGSLTELLSAHLKQRRSFLETERNARILQRQQRELANRDRIQALDREIDQVQQEIIYINQRVSLAKKTLANYQKLAQEGFVSDIQAQGKQEEIFDLLVRVENTYQKVAVLMREKRNLNLEINTSVHQLNIDLVQIDRELASMSQEDTDNKSRQAVVIRASQGGMVSAIYLQRGSVIQSGQNVATLVPFDKSQQDKALLVANLYAPSRNVGFVKQGQVVWIRYSAYPYQKFGMGKGIVQTVSDTPTAPQDLPSGQIAAFQAAAKTSEPLYRIKVKLNDQSITAYGESISLKAGMSLEADIVQETRAIWEWLFEPILAAHERIGSHGN